MPKKSKYIYMDHASTTPLDVGVAKLMHKYESVDFGNPSSIHSLGVSAKRAVEGARKSVANILNSQPKEIVFTSGGTEANNLAILGLVKSVDKRKYKHVITTAIEHQSILATCRALEKEGFEVTYLPVTKEGIVNPEDVKKALRPDTFLLSVMYANNEVGTVQPIAEIAKVLRRFRRDVKQDSKFPIFHTDACQAAGALSLNIAKLGVDMMTLSASKIYGPKGVGCLYVKNGIELRSIIYGGGQEKGLRSGTEHVTGIVGFTEALVLADSNKEKESVRLIKLRDYFAERILKTIPQVEINGSIKEEERLPNNLNVYIPNIDNEQLVLELDAIGVAVSSGSACNSNEETASHVILALGYDVERSRGSVRFSLGRSTTKKDIDFVIKNLPEIIKRISNSSF